MRSIAVAYTPGEMSWYDIDRSVHNLLGTVSRLSGVDEGARERILVELLDLDSRIHEELSKPTPTRPTYSRRDQIAGLLLLIAIVLVACFLGGWQIYWLFRKGWLD